MKHRLRVPRELVVLVLTTGAIAAAAVVAPSCGDDDDVCIRCLPDPAFSDAGVDAAPCPPCLPKDGVCPAGCIPEGFV
jgi:hypothetical protein